MHAKAAHSKFPHTSSSSPLAGHHMKLSLHPSTLTSPCFIFFSRTSIATPAAGSAFKAFARPSHYTQPLRTYASSKKKKMPPKKEVKQEKILLGRPGNSLKSGIVCTCSARTLRYITDISYRSVSPMSASRHSSRHSPSVRWVTPPTSHTRPSTLKKHE